MIAIIRKACKMTAAEVLYRLGYYNHLRKLYVSGGRKCIVLGYHRITEDGEFSRTNSGWRHPLEMGTPLSTFIAQMKFLRRHMTPVKVSDIPDYIEQKYEMPEMAVAVTFDDGYKDNYTHAYPVLCEYGIPATVFVTTGMIETGRLFWWDELCRILRHTQKRELRLDNIDLFRRSPNQWEEKVLRLESWKDRDAFCNMVIKVLRNSQPEEVGVAIDVLRRELELEEAVDEKSLMLSWQEIETMAKRLIEFGAHTVNHPCLSRIPAEVALREIEDSRKALEIRLKRKIVGFAYPWGARGDYSEETKALLKSRGFRYACTSLFGTVNSKSDPFEISRMSVTETKPALITRELVLALPHERLDWDVH